MEQRTAALGFTTLAVVAIAASAVRSPAPPGPPSSAEAAPAARSPTRPAAAKVAPAATFTRGQELLQRFFGGDTLPFKLRRYDFDVLIATLPDPVDSHLDWAFDTGLEAIRRAFESSGYVMEGFWLPPRDTVEVSAGGRPLPRRELEPAVMLFRGTEPATPRLRLLYLVPEVPTSGIYKEAFFTAFRERRRLRDSTTLPLAGTARLIRIVGPVFSGSAVSLQLALRRVLTSDDSVKIVSGSATSLSNLATLTNDSLRMRFSATVNPDESMQATLHVVLHRLGIPDSQVAILQESSTQYGQSLLATDTAGAAKVAPDSAAGGHRAGADFLTIPFPMSISSLRTEYQRLPADPTAGAAVPGATAAPGLPVDVIDPVRARVDLPVTSRLTPPGSDLVLDAVARTLRNHHIRMIGLLATDVRDKLFLGKELKQRVRDVRFFTFESNVLYLRPDHSRWLRGMLVFSTYPLLLEPHVDAADSRHLAFADEGAEGIYNATLVQLGTRQAMRDYGRLGPDSLPAGHPRVWLTTVGNALFLPVKTDSTLRLPCYLEPGNPDSVPGSCEPVRGVLTAEDSTAVRASDFIDFLPFASTTLVGVALVVLALRSWRDPDRPWRPITPTELEGEARTLWGRVRRDSLGIHERLYTTLRLTAAAAVCVAATVPFVLLPHATMGLQRWLAQALKLAALLGLASLIASWARLLVVAALETPDGVRFLLAPGWRSRWQQVFWGVEVLGRALIGVWGLLYFGLSVWFCRSVVQVGQSEEAGMFLVRAGAVDSLVSPLLPLILAGAGFAVWASWHLRRVALLRDPTVFECACAADLAGPPEWRSPVFTALHGDLRRAAKAVEQVRMRLFMLLPGAGALIMLGVLALLSLWIWPQFGVSLESLTLSRLWGLSSFDLLFRISILASFTAITWAAFRLLAVWRALRRCLAAIRVMPLLPAFERLPAELASSSLLGVRRPAGAGDKDPTADPQWLQLTKIYEVRRHDIAALFPRSDIPARMDALMSYPAARPLWLDPLAKTYEARRFRDLHALLCDLWEREPGAGGVEAAARDLQQAPAEAAPVSDTSGRLRRTFAGAAGLWRRAAEEYAAGVVADYLHWAMSQLYVLALFLLLSLLLMTALLSSYPFQPQSLLKLVFFFLLLATVGAMMLVLLQANRDEVLSRINQTEPGRVTWNLGFVTSVFTFGLVPILTLLSSEFPALHDAVFSWIEPVVKLVVKQ